MGRSRLEELHYSKLNLASLLFARPRSLRRMGTAYFLSRPNWVKISGSYLRAIDTHPPWRRTSSRSLTLQAS